MVGTRRISSSRRHGSGAGFFDHDGDADIDLYIVNGSTIDTYQERSGPGNGLYDNQGDGTFVEIAKQVQHQRCLFRLRR